MKTHDEIVQIVDRHNRKIARQPRSVMRAEHLIHRASYVLVFNDEGQLFVQQRTMTKDIFPGFHDIAAGGVVLAEETYEQSAARELAEELGVTDTPLTFHFDHYYAGTDNRVWGRVFSCLHNGPFTLQESEVAGGRFLSLAEIADLQGREPFTPDGLEILERLVKEKGKSNHGIFFLHGLDSSGRGTKGLYFAEHFPHILRPDFSGTLAERMHDLDELCRTFSTVTLIGSSFGGLMATLYAIDHPDRVNRLILLAPALNYGDYQAPDVLAPVPTKIIIGKNDTVTPPDLVLPLARKTFVNLYIEQVADDHFLHKSFFQLPWHGMLL